MNDWFHELPVPWMALLASASPICLHSESTLALRRWPEADAPNRSNPFLRACCPRSARVHRGTGLERQ